jgi:uncharacterized membrane protein
MSKILYYIDWLFKDLTERKGKYVIAEVPNLPLIVFMVSIILGVLSNPGGFQMVMTVIAYLAISYWGWQEWRGGRSRFRKLLGILGLLAVVGALVLRLGL